MIRRWLWQRFYQPEIGEVRRFARAEFVLVNTEYIRTIGESGYLVLHYQSKADREMQAFALSEQVTWASEYIKGHYGEKEPSRYREDEVFHDGTG